MNYLLVSNTLAYDINEIMPQKVLCVQSVSLLQDLFRNIVLGWHFYRYKTP
jgi:hypothetical protein